MRTDLHSIKKQFKRPCTIYIAALVGGVFDVESGLVC